MYLVAVVGLVLGVVLHAPSAKVYDTTSSTPVVVHALDLPATAARRRIEDELRLGVAANGFALGKAHAGQGIFGGIADLHVGHEIRILWPGDHEQERKDRQRDQDFDQREALRKRSHSQLQEPSLRIAQQVPLLDQPVAVIVLVLALA